MPAQHCCWRSIPLKTRIDRKILLACCFLTGAAIICPSLSLASPRPAETLARQIITESNFQGGLIVLIGPWDPDLAVSMGKAPAALVHWLVPDGAALPDARHKIRHTDMYGRVSAIAWNDPYLPYAGGTVNLLVTKAGKDADIPQPEMDRVLAPKGVRIEVADGAKIRPTARKPRPDNVDDWTHSRHDASGNAVSSDRCAGPPMSMQWEALPRWNRGTKTSALVSADGRLFYILDDSHFASNSRTWSLIARDAHNGIRLWRHELPSWGGAKGGKKVGPAQINRRLVALGERVYAPLGDGAPISIIDAPTGRILRVLDETAAVEEFLLSDGVLVALVNASDTPDFWRRLHRDMRIVAMRADTGEQIWKNQATTVLPMTLAADAEQVVYHDGRSIQSLDLHDGSPRWTSPPTGQTITLEDSWNPDTPGAQDNKIVLAPQLAPTMLIYNNVVAFAGGRRLNVVSADNGRKLWSAPYAATNYSTPVDLFGFDGAIWGPDTDMNLWRPTNDDVSYVAFDPLTGAVKKEVSGKYDYRFQHHRCHQMKVIGSTIVAARAGIEFLNTQTGELDAHHWVRGSCYFGVLPANGLMYVPPHNCACYIRAKLSGFMALTPDPALTGKPKISEDQRLRRGPAYRKNADMQTNPDPRDWPTYRHDAARSGSTPANVGSDLSLAWEAQPGGELTSPVIADGRAYVAASDRHLLHALDARTGENLWQYSFDAPIDSPPTIYQGLVLAGCRDGSVVALRATDGALAWKFLAAPVHRLIVSRGRLESTWPVHGSVLVVDDTVYFAAGKSSYLDGGIRFYGLHPHTGRKLVERILHTRDADGSQLLDEQAVDGYLNDILSSDGRRLFMRHQMFDKTGKRQPGRVSHLHSPDGYLSADTTSRLLWTYAPLYTSPHQGAFYDVRLSRVLFPSGRILVEDEETIYGFGQNYYANMRTEPGGTFALFASPKQSDVPLDQTARQYRKLALAGKHRVKFNWWKRIPISVWAMVRTKNVLFVAGPQGGPLVSNDALNGKAPGRLLAVSPADGTVLNEIPLPAMPVWDGMAAAQDSLYIALANGGIVRLRHSR